MKDTRKNLEFKMLSPFAVKFDAEISDTTDARVIRIAGYANWAGRDEHGVTYTDLAGDVVVPTGVDTSVWAGNPQILLQHDRDVTIGRGLSLEVRNDGLYLEAEIHADALDPKDWYRIKSGLLCMFSIGFRALDGEWKELDGRDVFFITRSLLLEVSVVSIPCNSHSGFSVIKAFGDGQAFGGSLGPAKKEDQPTGEAMKVKVKYADYLSATEVEDLKSKGVDVEQEVELSFVTLIKHVAGRVAEDMIKSAIEGLQLKEAEAEGGEGEGPAAGEEAPVEGGEAEGTPAPEAEAGEAAGEEAGEGAEELDDEDKKALEALVDSIAKVKELVVG